MNLLNTLLQKIFFLPKLFLHASLLKKIAVLIVIGLAGWGIYAFTLGNTTQKITYQTATAEKGTLVVSLSQSGTVSSANTASVTTTVSGVVSEVYVQNGDSVEMGDKIAEITLDQSGKQKQQQAYASYLQAKNTLDSANAQLYTLQSNMFAANQTFVNDKGSSSDPVKEDPMYVQQNADWLAAEAQYKNQQAVIAAAQTALNSALLTYQQSSPTVTAPINGTVTGLTIKEGSLLAVQSSSSDSSSSTTNSSSNQKIASIKTDGTPVVSLSISEIDAPKIAVGQKATITFDAFPNQTFTGTVFSVDTTGESSSGVTTYPTLIELDNANEKILPNMSATANIITNTLDNVILIPNAAIQTTDDGSFVQVLKNNTPQQIAVEVGLSNDTQTAITSGISQGDTIVTGTTAPATATTTTTTSPFSGTMRMGGGASGGTTTRTQR